MSQDKKWFGDKPKKCDICYDPLSKVFIDGKTSYGPWAILCPECHNSFGCGLGLGKGQKYDLTTLNKLEG